MKRIFWIFAGMFAMLSFMSCEEEVNDGEKDELIRLQAYMSIHYPDLEPSSTGLYSIIYEQGEGVSPQENDYIIYNYTASNLDGEVFETSIYNVAYLNNIYSASSRYVPDYKPFNEITFIAGLYEGISQLKPFARARFIIPSSLAWGSGYHNGQGPYASVIIDIELEEIVTDTEAKETEIIEEFLADYFPFGCPDSVMRDSVYYLEVNEGLGEYFVKDDIVDVNYVGRYIDGKVFDTNIESVAKENGIYKSGTSYRPKEMIVESDEIIEGFSLVLKRLRREGSATVIIRSNRAYGAAGTGNIHPYEPLIFEITVVTEYDEDEDGDNNDVDE